MADSTNKARNVRLTVLFTVLVLMLIGLWYDRKVARPSVEQAWDSIEVLNNKINSEAGRAAMTNTDVQQALNRQPSRTLADGPYQVEVYSWMAGLPFRTRDYYAVYTPGVGKLLFTTHFKYAIPDGELNPPPPRGDWATAEDEASPDMSAEADEMPGEGPRRKGRPRPAEDGETAAEETPAEMSAAEAPAEAASDASTPPAETPADSEAGEVSKPEEASEAAAPKEGGDARESAETASSAAAEETPQP